MTARCCEAGRAACRRCLPRKTRQGAASWTPWRRWSSAGRPGASSADWATEVAELGRAARKTFPPASDGLLAVADAWAALPSKA
eukprot:472407-Alexandrium_andersonii.AAC.1